MTTTVRNLFPTVVVIGWYVVSGKRIEQSYEIMIKEYQRSAKALEEFELVKLSDINTNKPSKLKYV